MSVSGFRRRRFKARFAWLALLALLFQHVAMIAYACPLTELSVRSEMTMSGCEEMTAPDPDAPALCDMHCHGDRTTTPDLRVAQVPPTVLPPLRFDFVASLLPPVPAQYYQDVPACRSDPPAAERFCSLQI